MGSSQKKKKSLPLLLGTIAFAVSLICIIYFFPYVVANKNSKGWFSTGKFAEVNMYPELAIKSYESAIARFPNENSFPMSSIIRVAKNRLNLLKQKLTGLDYPKVEKLLAAYDYNGLVKYFSSVNNSDLKLSFFSPTEKASALKSLSLFKKYLGGIQGYYGKDGESRFFTDKFKYEDLLSLKADLNNLVLSTKKEFTTSAVFLKNDQKRLAGIFAKSLKQVESLKIDTNFYATLEKIDDLASEWKSDISKIINNMHVGKIKKIARVDERLTKDLNNFTASSSQFYKVYNKAGFDIRQMGDLKLSAVALAKIKKDLMASYQSYSKNYLSVIKYATSFENVTAKKMSYLKKIIAMSSELKYFEKLILGFDNAVVVYKKIYANMALRIKTVQRQRDAAKGAAKVRLSKKVSSLKKGKRKIELLVGFKKKVNKIIDVVLAIGQEKSKVMNQFSSGGGEVEVYGIIDKMASRNYLTLQALLKKVFISDDKKRIIVVDIEREPSEQVKFLSLNLVKFSREVIIKNIAVITGELASGNIAKAKSTLDKFDYFSNFKKDYIAKKLYRFDYLKMLAGEVVANPKSIVDKIASFEYFYDDNGFLGVRYETLQLNDSILIPAVKTVITKAALKDSKCRNLLDDLKDLK